MLKLAKMLAVGVFLTGSFSSAICAETKKDEKLTPEAEKAHVMVKKGVEFFKKNGKDKFLAEVSNTKGSLAEGEYYLFVFNFEGVNLARGDGNAKLIGKNMLDMQDTTGKYYIKEMLNLAKDKNTGWIDYTRSNPTTKKVEPKSSYIEKIDPTMFVGCGFYKK